MANFKIPEKPEYDNNMEVLTTSDQAHADLFNVRYGQLLTNCEYLKKQEEGLQDSLDGIIDEETLEIAEETGILSGKGLTLSKKLSGIIKGLMRAKKSHEDDKNNPHKVTKSQVGLGNVDNTSDAEKPISTAAQAALDGKADLDNNGKVPSSQLPSYVDDVLEYSTKSAFPNLGESGKIYIDISNGLIYRWSGSEYANVSQSLALGETASTAYRGDRGKQAYDNANEALEMLNNINAGNITSGTLPIARGGTGQTTLAGVKGALGITALENIIPSVFGTVYVGTKLVGTVPRNTNTKVASVSVPAGTYIITANMQWDVDYDAFTAIALIKNSGGIATQRGNMIGGGGDSLSAIAIFDESGEISVNAFHLHTAPVGFSVDLKAIRIK